MHKFYRFLYTSASAFTSSKATIVFCCIFLLLGHRRWRSKKKIGGQLGCRKDLFHCIICFVICFSLLSFCRSLARFNLVVSLSLNSAPTGFPFIFLIALANDILLRRSEAIKKTTVLFETSESKTFASCLLYIMSC